MLFFNNAELTIWPPFGTKVLLHLLDRDLIVEACFYPAIGLKKWLVYHAFWVNLTSINNLIILYLIDMSKIEPASRLRLSLCSELAYSEVSASKMFLSLPSTPLLQYRPLPALYFYPEQKVVTQKMGMEISAKLLDQLLMHPIRTGFQHEMELVGRLWSPKMWQSISDRPQPCQGGM